MQLIVLLAGTNALLIVLGVAFALFLPAMEGKPLALNHGFLFLFIGGVLLFPLCFLSIQENKLRLFKHIHTKVVLCCWLVHQQSRPSKHPHRRLRSGQGVGAKSRGLLIQLYPSIAGWIGHDYLPLHGVC